MARKTFEVATMLKMANSHLAHKDTTEDGRLAICSFIEGVLRETGNYVGFRYLAVDGTTYVQDGARRYYFPSALIQAVWDQETETV